MFIKAGTCFVLAAACLVTVAAKSPAHAETAQQNVVKSQRYDRLLETNLSFRKARMRKECGPVTDQQLRANCLASFSQNEPYVGSSTSRRNYGSNSGR
jgi:hypothetical protein